MVKATRGSGFGIGMINFGIIFYLAVFTSLNANDYANRNIVIFLFTIYYIYLNFISSQLQRDRNWSGVKCNPLQMVLGSIINSEGSNNSFKRCMQYSNTQELNSQFEKFAKENEDKMKKDIIV